MELVTHQCQKFKNGRHSCPGESLSFVYYDVHKYVFSIQKNLGEEAPDWLLKWQSRMKPENAWLLNEVGWDEHQKLAQSFKKLNSKIFDERKYTVTSSFKVSPYKF